MPSTFPNSECMAFTLQAVMLKATQDTLPPSQGAPATPISWNSDETMTTGLTIFGIGCALHARLETPPESVQDATLGLARNGQAETLHLHGLNLQ